MDETLLISAPLEELSNDELAELLATLTSAVSSNEQTIDSQNQELYSLKREMSRLDSLAVDYKQETENLKQQYEEKLKASENLQDERNKTAKQREKKQEKINELKMKIIDIDEQITKIKGKEVLSIKTNEYSLNDIVKSEIEKLLQEEIKSQNDYELINVELQSALKSNQELKLEHALKNGQLEELQENLGSLNDNYQRINTEYQTMKDELTKLKAKMELQKSKPLEKDTRGNSLFAEVNDRRVQLEKNMQVMKTCYIDMKNEYGNLLHRISTLQLENLKLSEEWVNSTGNIDKDEEEIRYYRERIANLNVNIRSLKMELELTRKEVGSSKIGTMIEIKRRSFREALETLEQHLKSNIEYQLKHQFQTANMYKTKAISRKLQCEINKLKTDDDIKNCKKMFVKLEEDKENCE